MLKPALAGGALILFRKRLDYEKRQVTRDSDITERMPNGWSQVRSQVRMACGAHALDY